MNKIELLAPAGSMESLYAAINKGADAIYLGGNKFSARAYASNFDNDNMIKAIDYAHTYNVLVYVTLNTILKEKELEEAVKYIGFLYDIGVDGVIIQDLGLFKRIKEEYPDMEVHASTQMTIHNEEAAIFFTKEGFKRIVLSRELSLEEIKRISKDLGIETEIFIHGALCVCYSGQCLMSSMIGGRSGNRGRCAQPCRMEYTLKGDKLGSKKAYLLSPKDMCTIEDIEDIVNTGTTSLKIEGRMKRPEYVAGVVENYRKAIDSASTNEKYNAKAGEKILKQLFNRGGFSKAYLRKNTGKDMMSYKAQKNTGLLIGKINNNETIKLMEPIALGDGIRYGDKGFTLSKIILNGKEVDSAKIGDVVKIFPKGYKANEELYKMLDKSLSNKLEEYTKAYARKIPLTCTVEFVVNHPITIYVSYRGNDYIFTGEVVQKAEKKPLDKERISQGIKKSGESAFYFDNVEFNTFEDGFLRVSDINDIRRKALEGITKVITKSYRKNRVKKENVKDSITIEKDSGYNNIYVATTKEQLKALIQNNIENISVDIWMKQPGALNLQDIISLDKKVYLKTPNIIKSEFNNVVKIIERVKGNLKGIISNNIGIISKYKDQLEIIGDYKLNIVNSQSLAYYQQKNIIPTLSEELNRKEIEGIMKNNKGNVQYVVYGKTELMVSEYCPIGSTFGGKATNSNCNNACSNENFILIDRMKEEFRVMTDLYCRSYILNSKALNLIGEVEELKRYGINSFRIEFKDETYKEVVELINAMEKGNCLNNQEYTKGHYRRGVE